MDLLLGYNTIYNMVYYHHVVMVSLDVCKT